jgi:hypothetical protein
MKTHKKKPDDEPHDENTCFRCRLFKLTEEFTPNGTDEQEVKWILFTLSEVAGMLLGQLDPEYMVNFFYSTNKWRDVIEKQLEEEGADATKH